MAASTKAGAAMNTQRRRTRRSNGVLLRWRRCGRCWAESLRSAEVGSDSILFHPAIKGAPAEAQCLRGVADVACCAGQSLTYENTLHRFEAEVIETLSRGADLA